MEICLCICQTHCLHNIITNPPPPPPNRSILHNVSITVMLKYHHIIPLPAKIISPGVPGVIDADLISYNSLCSLHVFMGRGGLIQAMALVQDYFIINHDPLNSGNYIHKEITGVSVVGYI